MSNGYFTQKGLYTAKVKPPSSEIMLRTQTHDDHYSRLSYSGQNDIFDDFLRSKEEFLNQEQQTKEERFRPRPW